jgi:hypothetical protein
VIITSAICHVLILSSLQSASDRYPTKLIRPAVHAAGSSLGKRRAHPATKGGSLASGPTKRKRLPQVKKAESRTGTCDVCKRASIVLAPGSRKFPYIPSLEKSIDEIFLQAYCPPCTKKVGTTPLAAGGPSVGVSPAASNDALQTQATAASTPSVVQSTTSATKPKKSKQPATPQAPVVRQSPVQTPYSATGTPIQNYYAWQTQPPYSYHPFQLSHAQATQPLQSQHPPNQLETPLRQPNPHGTQSQPPSQTGVPAESAK